MAATSLKLNGPTSRIHVIQLSRPDQFLDELWCADDWPVPRFFVLRDISSDDISSAIDFITDNSFNWAIAGLFCFCLLNGFEPGFSGFGSDDSVAQPLRLTLASFCLFSFYFKHKKTKGFWEIQTWPEPRPWRRLKILILQKYEFLLGSNDLWQDVMGSNFVAPNDPPLLHWPQ